MDHQSHLYAPNTNAAPQSQQTSAFVHYGYVAPGSDELSRHSGSIQQSMYPITSTASSSGNVQQIYAPDDQFVAVSTVQQSPIQYVHDFQSPDVQRQQAQQYAQYGSSVVYGMAQPQTEQLPYDPISQYRQRPNTSSETFEVSQASQYYLAGQPSATIATVDGYPTPTLPSQYDESESYMQAGSSHPQSFTGSMMDQAQSSAYVLYTQHQKPTAPPQTPDALYDQYHTLIKTVFTLAAQESLRGIASQLLEASHVLLDNVEYFALTKDDDARHDERIQLWNEFNRAWLVTLQKQFDLTQGMMKSNRPLLEHQSIMSSTNLETLSRELVRFDDFLEKHGLVDYEMGVEEEQIMDLLVRCLNLLNPPNEKSDRIPPRANSSGTSSSLN